MGMFDTFRGYINCIDCKKNFEFEEQTKDYECLLSTFLLGDYIDKANQNYFYPFTTKCPHCGKTQKWNIAIKKGQIVGFFEESVATKELLNSLEEIEEGLGKKIKYKQACEEMLGYDFEKISNLNKLYSLEETINVLEKEWIIDGIYKEVLIIDNIPKKLQYFIKSTFKETLIFEVHFKEIKRFLIMKENQFIHLTYPIFDQKEHWDKEDYNNRYISQKFSELKKLK